MMFLIKAVSSAQETTGCKGPAFALIASPQQGSFGEVFISGIVVDNGDRAPGCDIFVVIGIIVFGIGCIDCHLLRHGAMMSMSLLPVFNKLICLLGIAWDSADSYGECTLHLDLHEW